MSRYNSENDDTILCTCHDETVEIHEVQISHYGGESGILNHGNLDFTVEMQTRFTDPFEVAAFLLYNIATLHPFCDGNKRTVFISAIYYYPSFRMNTKFYENLSYVLCLLKY